MLAPLLVVVVPGERLGDLAVQVLEEIANESVFGDGRRFEVLREGADEEGEDGRDGLRALRLREGKRRRSEPFSDLFNLL